MADTFYVLNSAQLETAFLAVKTQQRRVEKLADLYLVKTAIPFVGVEKFGTGQLQVARTILARLAQDGEWGMKLAKGALSAEDWRASMAAIVTSVDDFAAKLGEGRTGLSRFWDEVAVQTIADIPVKAPKIIGGAVNSVTEGTSLNTTLMLVGAILALWLVLKVV